MSDRVSLQSTGVPRKFAPNVNPLESRLLLSRQVSFPDGTSFVFPIESRLPRTGGVAVQSGTALTIGVGQPKTNAAEITLDGAGGAQAEWNGGPVHSFTGVQETLVQIGRARRNEVTFHLTGPRTSPAAIATGVIAATPAVSAKTLTHSVNALRTSLRTSGAAVQSGSVLTVTVTSPKTNTVEISSLNVSQGVEVEWNGGPVHSFSGVSTIIVNTKNGTNDLVGLDVAPVIA